MTESRTRRLVHLILWRVFSSVRRLLVAPVLWLVLGDATALPGIALALALGPLAAPLAVALVGLVIEVFTLRPLYGRNPLYHILLTFGIALLVQGVVERVWGAVPKNISKPPALEGSVGLVVVNYPSFRLFVTNFVNPDDGLANMGGLGMDDLQWHEPVRPGDTLSLQVEVVDRTPSESRDDRGYVDLDRRVYANDEDEVLSIRSYNVIRRRDAAE